MLNVNGFNWLKIECIAIVHIAFIIHKQYHDMHRMLINYSIFHGLLNDKKKTIFHWILINSIVSSTVVAVIGTLRLVRETVPLCQGAADDYAKQITMG